MNKIKTNHVLLHKSFLFQLTIYRVTVVPGVCVCAFVRACLPACLSETTVQM